ncbi:hypothetical protein [Mycobacterium sp. 050134]|uniref:hypothetical protein n=1 Tax=Mycobacterium sp. 050134 TaxID=3096111 RepID=UPI002EDA60C1
MKAIESAHCVTSGTANRFAAVESERPAIELNFRTSTGGGGSPEPKRCSPFR